MVYPIYLKYKHNYEMSLEMVQQILDEKTLIFQRTQPKAMKNDGERVTGGESSNALEDYAIEMEEHRINERLEEAKSLLEDRELLMKKKEVELRLSTNLYDKIFCMRVLDGMDIKDISEKIAYSESHTYRMVKKMIKNEN